MWRERERCKTGFCRGNQANDWVGIGQGVEVADDVVTSGFGGIKTNKNVEAASAVSKAQELAVPVSKDFERQPPLPSTCVFVGLMAGCMVSTLSEGSFLLSPLNQVARFSRNILKDSPTPRTFPKPSKGARLGCVPASLLLSMPPGPRHKGTPREHQVFR